MSIDINILGAGPAVIVHYPDYRPRQFCTLDISNESGRTSVFFHGLDAAAAWLQDALDKVQLAKAEHANTQPAPVHAEREANEERGCYADDPTDGFICTLPRGHDGDHQAHGPRTTDEFDGELLASWPHAESVAVQP